MMKPLHVRMARAALGWSLGDLANKAKVNLNTISRYEAGREVMSGTIEKMEQALCGAGIVFIHEDDSGGLGVRMQKRPMKKN